MIPISNVKALNYALTQSMIFVKLTAATFFQMQGFFNFIYVRVPSYSTLKRLFRRLALSS